MTNMKMLLFLILMCFVHFCQAQSEWFNQKQTQIKYYLTQIAGLQLYAGYLEKGYKIVKNGTNVIADIKRGDLNLHSNYINSLTTVKPTVKRYAKTIKIIDARIQLLSVYRKSVKSITKSELFTRGEINYCSNVYSNLINQTEDILDALLMVMSSGIIEMKDSDRIRKIDDLYADTQEKLAFAQKFSREAELLLSQRKRQKDDVHSLKALHGLQ